MRGIFYGEKLVEIDVCNVYTTKRSEEFKTRRPEWAKDITAFLRER